MTGKEKLEKIKALADKMYSRMAYLTSDTRPIRQAMDEYHQFIINEYRKEEPVSNILDMSKIDHKVQYASVKDGIYGYAEEYSFNIESELFNQLTPEQQALWRKEIEQAVVSGGSYGLELAKDNRYKENKESISEDLEEAANSYSEEHRIDLIDYETGEIEMNKSLDVVNAFKAGAQWQKEKDDEEQVLIYKHGFDDCKEQIMAKAINVEVKVDAGGYPYIPQMELYDYDKDVPLAKEGDKYNVVLIKED